MAKTRMPEAPAGHFFRVGPAEGIFYFWDGVTTTFGVALYKTVDKKTFFGKTKTKEVLVLRSREVEENAKSVADAAKQLLSILEKDRERERFVAEASGTYPPKKEIA